MPTFDLRILQLPLKRDDMLSNHPHAGLVPVRHNECLTYCKTIRTCPIRKTCRRATDNNTPGLVAPHAFCKFSSWGMSELFCNTAIGFGCSSTAIVRLISTEFATASSEQGLQTSWLPGQIREMQADQSERWYSAAC